MRTVLVPMVLFVLDVLLDIVPAKVLWEDSPQSLVLALHYIHNVRVSLHKNKQFKLVMMENRLVF
jgi:hypothetical protein